MLRRDLRQLLEDAANLAPGEELVVIGSQAILGWFDDAVLPAAAVFSREADVYAEDDADETTTTMLDAVLGELSAYDAQHGMYLQGVGPETARLPSDWRTRSQSWPLPGGGRAHFPEPHDLASSKLAADRPKDREFVSALLEVGLLEIEILMDRFASLEVEPIIRRRVERFLVARQERA